MPHLKMLGKNKLFQNNELLKLDFNGGIEIIRVLIFWTAWRKTMVEAFFDLAMALIILEFRNQELIRI